MSALYELISRLPKFQRHRCVWVGQADFGKMRENKRSRFRSCHANGFDLYAKGNIYFCTFYVPRRVTSDFLY